MRMRLKGITLTVILAAVYAVLSFLPGFPVIGVSGSKIDVARSLEIIYGLVLGPVLGPFTAFLGAIVGKTLAGGGIGLFFTPLAIVSSFMAAAMNRRKFSKLGGWIFSATLLAGLIICWYLTPTGRDAPYYPIPHLVGLGMILLFRGKIMEYLHSRERSRLVLGVLLSSYPSTMAGHMLGNLIFMQLSSQSALFFVSILPISIIERVTLTVIATIIGVPLIMMIRSLYPELFPHDT